MTMHLQQGTLLCGLGDVAMSDVAAAEGCAWHDPKRIALAGQIGR